ncbi:hypothetical protein H206_05644 [Candidatus Electrothrix aarhusensis]|uniref:Uncharacterized protein n=1 Tax=Candidatus Electrothrix aarhusensis TaxID=1859131 RepID=A0A444J3P8_9BACT|nr:hypothetical protein H206_05644 [Candidatus Electrothrix aarhusensis]
MKCLETLLTTLTGRSGRRTLLDSHKQELS